MSVNKKDRKVKTLWEWMDNYNVILDCKGRMVAEEYANNLKLKIVK
jgi:hypothetical protein